MVNFNIPYLPSHERLAGAEVRFLRNNNSSSSPRRYRFRVHIRSHGKLAGKYVVRERGVRQSQYDVFDISKLVRPYVKHRHGNISVQVKISRHLLKHTLVAATDTGLVSTSLVVLYLRDHQFLKNMYQSFTSQKPKSLRRLIRDVSASQRSEVTDTSDDPTLEISRKLFPDLDEMPAEFMRREKRDVSAKRRRRKGKGRKWFRNGRKEDCQMYDYDVDFNTIGWGQWIIHPKRFNSKFCFGQCPSPIDVKYVPTNHAMLQTLMRMKRPSVAPAPCCVPTRLSPVSMLYMEYDEIVVRHHEDMIADQCGCR